MSDLCECNILKSLCTHPNCGENDYQIKGFKDAECPACNQTPCNCEGECPECSA